RVHLSEAPVAADALELDLDSAERTGGELAPGPLPATGARCRRRSAELDQRRDPADSRAGIGWMLDQRRLVVAPGEAVVALAIVLAGPLEVPRARPVEHE